MTEREQIRLEIKRQLNSYRDLREEQRQLQDELQRLEELMSSPSGPNIDGMPRSPGVSNPVERMVTEHIILEDRYRAQIKKMVQQQTAIEDLIESLDPTERRLARFRYIDGMTWEEVCYNINYSWMQTHRIHGRMLDKLVDAELKRKGASE
jgi:RinA family phage transcriptional activator